MSPWARFRGSDSAEIITPRQSRTPNCLATVLKPNLTTRVTAREPHFFFPFVVKKGCFSRQFYLSRGEDACCPPTSLTQSRSGPLHYIYGLAQFGQLPPSPPSTLRDPHQRCHEGGSNIFALASGPTGTEHANKGYARLCTPCCTPCWY